MIDIQHIYSLFRNSEGISTDTRRIVPGTLFFALKGANFNGNTFASEAIKLGASYAIIDEPEYASERTLLVPDVLTALQQLATLHRKTLAIPVIGIAGSNGKTTTKELIHAVLATTYRTFATKGNLNNHIGVPLSLLSIAPDVEVAVIELGANHIGELAVLCQIAEPTHGLITNNGLDHLEGYGSFEGVVQGNSELYYWLLKHKGTPFVNATDPILMQMASRFAAPVYYGTPEHAGYVPFYNDAYFLRFQLPDQQMIETELFGMYNAYNIWAALSVGHAFRIPMATMAKAIAQYRPTNNRSQMVVTDRNRIILDCYNANPSSMEASLESFSKIAHPDKRVFLGDMFELGSYSASEHMRMINRCKELGFAEVHCCGTAFSEVTAHWPGLYLYKNREALEGYLSQHTVTNAFILVKGSRGMAMERLVNYL